MQHTSNSWKAFSLLNIRTNQISQAAAYASILKTLKSSKYSKEKSGYKSCKPQNLNTNFELK